MASESPVSLYKGGGRSSVMSTLSCLGSGVCDWFFLCMGRALNRFDKFFLASQACSCARRRCVSVVVLIVAVFVVIQVGWLILFLLLLPEKVLYGPHSESELGPFVRFWDLVRVLLLLRDFGVFLFVLLLFFEENSPFFSFFL